MAKEGHKPYTEKERAEALELYTEHGPAEAARRTGIARNTISKWASRAGVTGTRGEKMKAATEAARLSWQHRRAEITDTFGEVAAEKLEALRQATGTEDALRLAKVCGILVDKAQLLSGGATGRLDFVTPEQARQELEQTRDELAERRARRTAAA